MDPRQPLSIRQFRYAADNLAYLVHDGEAAVAVDPGAVDAIAAFAAARGLRIRQVLNTHTHGDHTLGNQRLCDRTGAAFTDCRKIDPGTAIPVGRGRLTVYRTPGHSDDDVTFHAGAALITGDTLFNGTVGNCFSGDLKAFYDSIRLLLDFPPETRIYAGHDYVAESMAAARSIEPDNPAVDRYLAAYDPDHVVSTLADELAVNPYLRFNAPSMVRILEARGLPVGTEYERWCAVMTAF